MLVPVKSNAFEIRDCPFFTKVAEACELIVSYMAILCAGENGEGGLNDVLELADALMSFAVYSLMVCSRMELDAGFGI